MEQMKKMNLNRNTKKILFGITPPLIILIIFVSLIVNGHINSIAFGCIEYSANIISIAIASGFSVKGRGLIKGIQGYVTFYVFFGIFLFVNVGINVFIISIVSILEQIQDFSFIFSFILISLFLALIFPLVFIWIYGYDFKKWWWQSVDISLIAWSITIFVLLTISI